MKDLTCCIAFRNEGDEVESTIKSIVSTASDVHILVVDDCSDDGIDYKNMSCKYPNTEYHCMESRVGSVGTKDWAARNASTEYVVLLDGHMRFYESGWDDRILGLLKKYPKSFIIPRTIFMSDAPDIYYDNDKQQYVVDHQQYMSKMHYYGAKIKFDGAYTLDTDWTDDIYNYNEVDNVSDVKCILGACYGVSKTWWNHIGGFDGLKVYGIEESFLSYKTYMCGGSCKVMHDIGVGHLYREKNPHAIPQSDMDANRLSAAYILGIDISPIIVSLWQKNGLFEFGPTIHAYSNRFEDVKNYKEAFDNVKICEQCEFIACNKN